MAGEGPDGGAAAGPRLSLLKLYRDRGLIVTLWDLLTLVCFVMPIGGAHAAAELARVGLGGHLVAIPVGMFVGAGCAWAVRSAGGLVITRLGERPAEAKENSLRVLYLVAFIWSFCGLFIGGWAAGLVMPLIK
jgi:hypothetical protein